MTALPLIPAAALAEIGRGSFSVVDGTSIVLESPELREVAALVAADVRGDGGPALQVASQDAGGPGIHLSLSRDGLDDVAIAKGVRADGALEADERHGIVVSDDGVRVWGPTPEAVHRGLTTLRQLLAGGSELAEVRIVDGPRFAWRGLSLDVARTFHDVETVERVIDLCALYKLNVLHLHLTDDQGWRLEVPSRPALTEIGARWAIGDRPGGFYTQAEIAELVAYAEARFVTIVPEIDLPGHAAAVFRSYPELAPDHAAAVLPHNGAAVAAGALDPADPETWRFVDDVLDAVVAQFPRSAYVHIGGDEAFGMDAASHAEFVERAVARVRARGRFAVGWQETARAALDDRAVVQHWIDIRAEEAEALRGVIPSPFLELLISGLRAAVDDVPRALVQGARLIVSPTSRLYFDRPHADASTDAVQEAARRRLGLPVYPPTRIRDGVEWDVVADTAWLDSDAQVAGVEAAVWCETVTGRDDLELLLLPRLPGASEKGWARAGATDWDEYRVRLAAQASIWEHRGWTWLRVDSVPWPAVAAAV